ncbi:MAG TPA: PKD domain-containing protein [Saprospiraceae bacterium]|nr:PKD domain-containing protein [Saprospiraceae bacterium]
MYDFNRCTGLLSNERWWHIPLYGIAGISISPNGRYLYATDVYYLWQYDLYADDIEASRMTVAEWDGYVEPNWFETYFGMMAPAPDGRIYIIPPTGGSMVMHVIDRPNERGEACRVMQHHIKLPTWNARTLPNFPNFRLGPLDGSFCDTLGIDNMPVARFRHEAEENDLSTIRFTDLSYYGPEIWEWDFGDGATAGGADQLHEYTATGTYTVCLTVSNTNASHTSCQQVYAEVASAVSSPHTSLPLRVFPNPFENDLTFGLSRHEIIDISLTDLHGKTVLHVDMTCPCTISLSHLDAGVYFWSVTRADGKIESGKVVKA